MSKGLWNILLIVISIFTLWKVGPTALDLWRYYQLEIEVPADKVDLEVQQKGGRYRLIGHYRFSYGGRQIKGQTVLGGPKHLNLQSAERNKQSLNGMDWRVWVDPKHPSCSSLEKHFPYKNIFYSICLLGITLYFVYLRIHLQLLLKSS